MNIRMGVPRFSICAGGWSEGQREDADNPPSGHLATMPRLAVPPRTARTLPSTVRLFHPLTMFIVTEAQAAMIRATYERRGEFSAAVELRQLFPGIVDNAQARLCVRTIAGWRPLPKRLPVRVRADKGS